ncbi:MULTISPECIES: tripartite tricarboxylate transporter permease [Brevibacillus]|uniref:Tripartite tricarboxylate transporter permease n=2 Tax=Brevibacillus TaxID=55080 RepID=A0A3M8D5X6_9BACL|nr:MULTISPECIES: tripartite tricarboxylate transporter permease [Brevibacillus]MEC2129576.1 tripartite tricarboxylate transporter permease [Brevibacillus centrosporus]MED4909003.1 tripartite tricarboxylate transporter permease [Brevibacillus centrosporus]RNB65437.1 tripartite tricarboxylate transporter permease [Brevibacillus centrosporus]RNB83129.1 tripartite tricarboxylate transporter permease [Brevibacillus nitrificans]SFJ39233.1 putative tricarboxylic transport membrane protein [Brevibacil
MEALGQLIGGFETAFTWWNLLYCLIGVTVGMLVGVLPGLGPTTGTALLIPMTFGMEPVSAIIMLSGIYYGSMYGGTITSVLINTPGEAASVITCLDGHPLAKQGRAGVALGVAGIGSFIGGTISIIGLAFIGPALAELALKFGPPEFFALMIFGLIMVIGLMGRSLIRGLIAAFIGLILSLIGMDPVSGAVRFTFGEAHLMNGLDLVTVAMGLFGLSEILFGMENLQKLDKPGKVKGLLPRKEEWRPTLNAIGRGTGLGFFVGLIPGSNSVIPAILSYTLEKRIAKDPSRFGKGAIEGVAGPETANNSYCGAALIPLFTLGIPSSPTIAIILGAFIMHGLTPGPTLFQNNPDFVWAIIASMFIGNLILLIMNLPMAGMWAKIAAVPPKLLYPLILIISIIGAYTVSNSLWDVGVMFVFGIAGYIMKKLDIPMAPIVLTFVLSKLMENSLLQSIKMFDGNVLQLFARPISGTLLVLSLIVLCLSVIAEVKKKKAGFASDVEM